jgi:hypothetical protein
MLGGAQGNGITSLCRAVWCLLQGAKVTGRLSSLLAAVDSLMFQGLASVVFPSFTINRWVTFSGGLLGNLHEQGWDVPDVVLEYLPTLTGLVIIPIICAPLDTLTHRLLDVTFRPVREAIADGYER